MDPAIPMLAVCLMLTGIVLLGVTCKYYALGGR